MILSLRIKNYFVISEPVEISFFADRKIKKFATSTVDNGNYSILKSLGLFGANNVGKSTILRAIDTLKCAMLNIPLFNINVNFFKGENAISELGISYCIDDRIFDYDFSFDTKSRQYIAEKLSERIYNAKGGYREALVFEKDTIANIYNSMEGGLATLMPQLSSASPFLHMLNFNSKYTKGLDTAKNLMIDFAKNIDVVSINEIPVDKTINLLKTENTIKKSVVELIKTADVDLTDIVYDENAVLSGVNEKTLPDEKVLQMTEKLSEILKLFSVHSGKKVPSMLFDSTGTKKLIAAASYIVEAIKLGKVLVIDEIDSSLHSKLTRAIVAMFNNSENKKGQLIFSSHDISLMDCKKLMRKDQVWFVDKDEERVIAYGLKSFVSDKGVRGDTSDIPALYTKGVFGALPYPEIFEILLED